MKTANRWLTLTIEQQKRYIETVGIANSLSVEIIEKDWWVTMVLKAIFSTPFASHLSFKGGTSLSKCWHLIERFSEDLDIAINREFLGFAGELSKTQISDKLRRASCSFVRGVMKEEIEKNLLSLGIDKSLFDVVVNVTTITTTDPEIIEVYYQSLFPNTGYIRDKVIIEVSGRSMNEPVENVEINSIISATFPDADFAEQSFQIKAVSPKRTFLEKACLLHEEFSKSATDIRCDRMSRHIYDLGKLMDTEIAKKAINDIELYKSVIEHRKKFIGLNNFDYSTLFPQTISFIPPAEVIFKWKDDYESMQANMIYGSSLSFEKLIERITDLNKMFRNVDF